MFRGKRIDVFVLLTVRVPGGHAYVTNKYCSANKFAV